MITVPVVFARHIVQVNGLPGAQWLATLPGLFARLISAWDLTPDGEPLSGGKALVLPVRLGGALAALKISWRSDFTRDEAAALEYWAGRGTVRLLRSDPSAGAMLLERLDPTRTPADLPNDEVARVLGDLIRHTAVPAMPGIATVANQVAEIVASTTTYWEEAGRPYPRSLLDRSLGLARQLPVSTEPRMVNGDLWDGNVLATVDDPCRWVVIDPSPVAGDPEYGLAQILWHRADRFEAPADLDRFIGIVCETAGLDRNLADAWTIVRTADFWLWAIGHGQSQHPPRCAKLLRWLT